MAKMKVLALIMEVALQEQIVEAQVLQEQILEPEVVEEEQQMGM